MERADLIAQRDPDTGDVGQRSATSLRQLAGQPVQARAGRIWRSSCPAADGRRSRTVWTGRNAANTSAARYPPHCSSTPSTAAGGTRTGPQHQALDAEAFAMLV
ncbi:hypothetical protein KUTG_10194 [Kutzneria sp. 744]|nr:hypothetical protein KUTG_10194 [Kutzneria sp. 744]